MLPKLHRLTKRKDFDALFKGGKLIYGRQLQARVAKTGQNQPTRIAIVISAKTEKSAVKRNRAKRQVREVLRKVVSQIKPGFDVAITIKHSFLPLPFDAKQTATLELVKKASLLA